MQVLTVVNSLGLGGIETGLLHLIPHLKKRGIGMDVCCLGPASVLDSDFESMGCRIWRIPKSANMLSTANSIEGILRQGSYELLHSHFGHTSGGLALGAARMGVPCVVSIHSSEPLSLSAWKGWPFLSTARKLWLTCHQWLMNKYADMFIGHSRANLLSFEPNWQQNQSRYRVILNGVPVPNDSLSKQQAREVLGLDASVPILLHVGSFRAEKNHAGLLQIFHRVLQGMPNAKLLMVGDGPLRDDIVQLAKAIGILGDVRWEGLQKNVWPYYRAADLFVFPSITEGFGMALVESALAGLPLVASDIPAHREAVPTVQQRFLFPPGNYDQAAALAIEQLTAARDCANSWVSASQNYARSHFTIERFAHEIGDVYETVVKAA